MVVRLTACIGALSLLTLASCDKATSSQPATPLSIACGSSEAPAHQVGLVLTSHFVDTSTLDVFGMSDPDVARPEALVASSDAVLRKIDVAGKPTAFVLNRGADSNIMRLAPDCGVDIQTALPHCGPHDAIALDDGRVLVTCYESSSVIVLDENLRELQRIDLTAFADPDDNAEVDSIVRLDDLILVSIQNLDRGPPNYDWKPTRNGRLVAIDAATLEVIDTDTTDDALSAFELACRNPLTALQVLSQSVIVGCGGEEPSIVSIELGRGSSRVLANAAQLGGAPTTIALGADNKVYALVTVTEVGQPFLASETRLVTFDPKKPTREVTVLHSAPGFSLSGLALTQDGTIYFGNRNRSENVAGMWRRDPDGNLSGPFKTSLPPVDIVLFE